MTDQTRRAQGFRDLHRQGGLILPNAWDAASARVFQTSGFAAVATTSAGVAWARIAAMRAAAPGIVINARTDVFLLGLGDSDAERVGMAIERGRAWLKAGADVVFLPGVTEPAVVKRLAEGVGGPISLMAGPDAPPAAALFAAGACRISTGPYPMLAVLERLKNLADGLAEDWSAMSPAGDGLTKISIVFG